MDYIIYYNRNQIIATFTYLVEAMEYLRDRRKRALYPELYVLKDAAGNILS